MRVIALVGMTGSGKTSVSQLMEKHAFHRIRFGDITDRYLKENGLEPNEKNEKYAREFLRKKYGMAGYAILNIPLINEALELNHVVVDGIYSWEEYKVLKEKYKDKFIVIAIFASPLTRAKRLKQRLIRPLEPNEVKARDIAEIENIQKAGPIAVADITIINEGTLGELKKNVDALANVLKES